MKLYNVSLTVSKHTTPKGRIKKTTVPLPEFEIKLDVNELFKLKKFSEGYKTDMGRIFTNENFREVIEVHNDLLNKSYHIYAMCPKNMIDEMKLSLKNHLKERIKKHSELLNIMLTDMSNVTSSLS
jgi:hypothetical protein